MWERDDLQEAQHNTKAAWNINLGTRKKNWNFVMFFISKPSLIFRDHKLETLENKGGGGHTVAAYAFLWASCFRCGWGQVACKSFPAIPRESLHIYVLMSSFLCLCLSCVSQQASHITDQPCCVCYEWIVKSFHCFFIPLVLQAAGSVSGVAPLCAKTSEGEISLWVEFRVSKQ